MKNILIKAGILYCVAVMAATVAFETIAIIDTIAENVKKNKEEEREIEE